MIRQKRNLMTGLAAAVFVAGMVGLAFASVPLYRIFCQVTGFGGTPRIAAAKSVRIGERVITVRFDSNLASGMPWRFQPVKRQIDLRVGEQKLAFYRARNDSGETITGTATFNVTPAKAGYYFNKVDCFCFTEQTLAPGQEVDMPVSFFIDPDIVKDRNLDEVSQITLSYTFFRAKDGPATVTLNKTNIAAAGAARRRN